MNQFGDALGNEISGIIVATVVGSLVVGAIVFFFSATIVLAAIAAGLWFLIGAAIAFLRYEQRKAAASEDAQRLFRDEGVDLPPGDLLAAMGVTFGDGGGGDFLDPFIADLGDRDDPPGSLH